MKTATVRPVANTYHFAYDDGKEYYPCGTTCYVWELQSKETQEKTYESLASSPFNKIRFCVFPKHYVYNLKEPHSIRLKFVKILRGLRLTLRQRSWKKRRAICSAALMP